MCFTFNVLNNSCVVYSNDKANNLFQIQGIEKIMRWKLNVLNKSCFGHSRLWTNYLLYTQCIEYIISYTPKVRNMCCIFKVLIVHKVYWFYLQYLWNSATVFNDTELDEKTRQTVLIVLLAWLGIVPGQLLKFQAK